MRTILIDDELDSLESLKTELSMYCPRLEIIASYNDSIKALEEIGSLNPELVFLDIEMPQLNGFEFLMGVKNLDFDVIFVTAYDEFAVKAFDFNAVDYLLKPVIKSKLISAVDKVYDKNQHNIDNARLKALINNLSLHNGQRMENIALPTSDGFEFVHVNDIKYIQAESNYTWVYLTNGSKYLLSKTLKEMSAMISFSQFFRAHQSYYVNMNHVIKYVRGQGGYLIMDQGIQIPVSRSNKKALITFLTGR